MSVVSVGRWLANWDQDLKLQMLVKKEASEGFMIDEVEASELRIDV